MQTLSKLLRLFYRIFDLLRNRIVLFKLKMKYPAIKIEGKTIIESNCKIICEDGGELILVNSYISAGSEIRATKTAKIIIRDSFIGRNCVFVAIESIEIQEGCEIAEMVVIRDQDHVHNLTSQKISKQGFKSSPIMIRNNVWLGCKVTVLKGVEIGPNSIVGAHTLVNHSAPESSILVGIPAKRINNNG